MNQIISESKIKTNLPLKPAGRLKRFGKIMKVSVMAILSVSIMCAYFNAKEIKDKVNNTVSKEHIAMVQEKYKITTDVALFAKSFENYNYTEEMFQNDLIEYNKFIENYTSEYLIFEKVIGKEMVNKYEKDFGYETYKKYLIYYYLDFTRQKINNPDFNLENNLNKKNIYEYGKLLIKISKNLNEKQKADMLAKLSDYYPIKETASEKNNRLFGKSTTVFMMQFNFYNILGEYGAIDGNGRVAVKSNYFMRSIYKKKQTDLWANGKSGMENYIPELKVIKKEFLEGKHKDLEKLNNQINTIMQEHMNNKVNESLYDNLKIVSYYNSLIENIFPAENDFNFKNHSKQGIFFSYFIYKNLFDDTGFYNGEKDINIYEEISNDFNRHNNGFHNFMPSEDYLYFDLSGLNNKIK